MNKMNVKRLRPTAQLPSRATGGSAGYDLHADLDAPLSIRPGEIKKIPTGIAIAIGDNNAVGLVYARSGLASKFGIAPINCVGVIDSDYRGELLVPLTNHGMEEYVIRPGAVSYTHLDVYKRQELEFIEISRNVIGKGFDRCDQLWN